jgi:hypothetical protein
LLEGRVRLGGVGDDTWDITSSSGVGASSTRSEHDVLSVTGIALLVVRDSDSRDCWDADETLRTLRGIGAAVGGAEHLGARRIFVFVVIGDAGGAPVDVFHEFIDIKIRAVPSTANGGLWMSCTDGKRDEGTVGFSHRVLILSYNTGYVGRVDGRGSLVSRSGEQRRASIPGVAPFMVNDI